MADNENAIAVLGKLKEIGVSISIDDFGTGMSSLEQLKVLPVDILKIDRSFILDLDSSPESSAVVRAILNLANNLGLEVIAEGVETEDQLRFLQKLECGLWQGFLLSQPVPADEFDLLMV